MRHSIDGERSRSHVQKYFARSPFIVGILVTAGFSTAARAADVTITVTGTVFSGTDKTGVFFPGQPNTDLTGKPYTLTFTFDDTKGMKQATASQSYIKSTPSSDPGTAVLQIGNGTGSFGFGTLGYSPFTSEVHLTAGVGGPYVLQAGDGSYGSNWNNLQGTVYPAKGTALTTNPSWEAAFSDANLYVSPSPSNNYSLSFGILESFENKVTQSASGYLTAESISVSGAYTCSAGDTPPTLGTSEHHYTLSNFICSPLESASCTTSQVFLLLREHPTPVDRNTPINTCDVTYIPPLVSSFPSFSRIGHVISYVNPTALSVTNVTLPDHVLYPGQVARSVINDSGFIYILTVGTGDPIDAWWWDNEVFWTQTAPLIWNPVDQKINDWFKTH